MKKIRLLLFCFYWCLLLFCCSQQNSSRPIIEIKANDTVKKDIPLDSKGNFSLGYTRIRIADSVANLTPLDRGFNELCIRISLGYSFGNTYQVIELKKTNNQWESKFYAITLYHNKDSIISIDKKVATTEPISGWETFINKLLDLGILTLPDDGNFKNYQLYTGGLDVIVQIATPSTYKIYSYSNPDLQEIAQAKKMEEILKLIESEFDFQRLK